MKPTWDEYFMMIAEVVAVRSPDPKYKVGAVVVSEDKRILGTGYNGFIKGFDDSSVNWNHRETIRPLIIHAEMNAILYSKTNLTQATLYITISPCTECIKLIAASGIKDIVYKDDYKEINNVRKFCIDNGIHIRQL